MRENGQLVALVTGASSGFGKMIATALADRGHVAYASTREADRDTSESNATYSRNRGVDLRSLALDVRSEESCNGAIQAIIDSHGRLDVLVHNAGHMVYGPSEAFTPEQLAELYDINVLGTHRLNCAALPHMRAARSGLLVWISSTSVAGGVPPLLGPYFAAKAGMDALAVCIGKELAPLGIETSIVVPGAFTTGTNHFAHAGEPGDAARAHDYERTWRAGFAEDIKGALAQTVPGDADPFAIARAVVDIVAASHGNRPYRVVIDPADDGAAVSFAVIDRIRAQFLTRIGHAELLKPTR